MDLVFNLITVAVLLLAAFGLSFWAYRARTDRSAYVGLFLLLGFPAGLLVVAGLACLVTLQSPRLGAILLIVGLGLGLPLLRPFRRWMATVTPLDPASPVDMVGLSLLLATIGVLSLAVAIATGSTDAPAEIQSATTADLVVQLGAEVALAYAAVGWWFHRSFRQASQRLGLRKPTWGTVGVALGFVVLGFVVATTGSVLTEVFQPGATEQLEQVTEQLTAEVQNPVGAAVLGISAGIGEELLFRGAFQPRFGIVLTALAFALIHTGQYGFTFVVLGLFGMGLLLGWERNRYGTTAAIITHAVFNFLVVLVQVYA